MTAGEERRSIRVVRALTVTAAAFAVVHALLIAFLILAFWFLPMVPFFLLLFGGPVLTVIALVAALVVRDRMHVVINAIMGGCYLAVWGLLYYLLEGSVR